MLKPIQFSNSPPTNLQRAQTHAKTEKQKGNTSADNTVAGQTVASVLDEFLDADELDEIIPDDIGQTQQPEQSASTEELVEITEKMEASATQIDQEELVAELLETVPELQIDEEQLDVFAPVLTDDTDGVDTDSDNKDAAVKNLVEAVVETMAETSVEELVSTFVETEDIAKLVSSKTNVWSHVGMKLVEKTVMLLKNGMAYTDLKTPPGALEIPSSLESAVGTAWTSWRQDEETGAIYLGSGGISGEKRLIGAEIDITPLSIEDIAGTHTKVRAEARGITQLTHWSDVVFHQDGTFEYAEAQLRTTGGIDTIWQESFTQSASYVSANRPRVSDDGTLEAANRPPNTSMFGSFNLAEDGLSIELTYADGSVESRLMYKNDGYIHFGQSSFKTRPESQDQLERLRDMLLDLGNEELLGADVLAVLADSMALANDNSSKRKFIVHAPSNVASGKDS